MGVFCFNNVQSCLLGRFWCGWHTQFVTPSPHPTKCICIQIVKVFFWFEKRFVNISKDSFPCGWHCTQSVLIQQNAMFSSSNYYKTSCSSKQIFVSEQTQILKALEFLKQDSISIFSLLLKSCSKKCYNNHKKWHKILKCVSRILRDYNNDIGFNFTSYSSLKVPLLFFSY